LDSLQQDVVLAKQKHQRILTKMGSMDDAFESAQPSRAQRAEEAIFESAASGSVAEPAAAPSLKMGQTLAATPEEDFRKSLESLPARRVVTAVPAVDAESPLRHLDPTPEKGETLLSSARKKFVRWPRFDFLFPNKDKPISSPPAHSKMPTPTPIADGEALFKVAISDQKITVEEAVDIGLANNIKLQAAKKSIEVAAAKVDEAKRGLFPAVQYVWERNGGKVPGVAGSRFYKGKNQKLNVSQPLYYGGELQNTVKQAEENLRISRAEFKKAKDDLIHQIRVAYYGVVKAEYNAEYQIELFEKIGEILRQVRAQREMRVSPEIDALNVESQYYQVLYQLEASKNDVLSANVSLKQSINLEMEGVVPVDLRMNFVKVNPKFEEMVKRALENNADIRVKAFGVEAARYGIDIYESKKKPHFDLRGSYGMLGEAFHDTEAFEDGKASIDPEREWFLGVAGSMPLGPNSVQYEQVKHVYGPTVLSLTGSEDWRHHVEFNLFDRMGAITDENQAQYVLLQAESEYKDVRDEVTLRLRDEFYSLQRYLIQIDTSIAKLRYQNKQLSILEYLLGLQETTPSNYVENLISQVQDRYAFIQAVADYNVALSGMGLLIGDPFYFENQREMAPQKYEASEITRPEEK
jgi:outer membrane protein TolC